MESPVFLALGSNIGDLQVNLETAIQEIRHYFRTDKISSLYHTKPYGKTDQDNFLNIVLTGFCDDTPEGFLQKLMNTEIAMGRTRAEKWRERIIDIDILFWGDRVVNTPDLIIPHYDYKNRDFFIVPAAEIAANFYPPGEKRTLGEMAKTLAQHTIIKKEPMFESLYRH